MPSRWRNPEQALIGEQGVMFGDAGKLDQEPAGEAGDQREATARPHSCSVPPHRRTVPPGLLPYHQTVPEFAQALEPRAIDEATRRAILVAEDPEIRPVEFKHGVQRLHGP